MISTFMGQINSLQTELRQLAQAQSQTKDLISRRDQAFQNEQRLTDSMKKKYLVSIFFVALLLSFVQITLVRGDTGTDKYIFLYR